MPPLDEFSQDEDPTRAGETSSTSPSSPTTSSSERLASAGEAPTLAGGTGPASIDRPDRIGRYRIERRLGQGGQGSVFLAHDDRLERAVALKVLGPSVRLSAAARERFEREARAASRLRHPGICGVFEIGDADGIPFIVMQYVEGETLAHRVAAGRERQRRNEGEPMIDFDSTTTNAADRSRSASGSGSRRREVDAVCRRLEDVARAVHVAHLAGLIHRDIKPGNIMVPEDGPPVLLDFGLARDTEEADSELTQSGDVFGTPAYMSPEQLAGKTRLVDQRTDVYALGVTLYECLTLEKPFAAPTLAELSRRVEAEPVPDPRRRNRHIPGDLRVILETALEKDARRRYRSAEEFADDLQRFRRLEPIRAQRISALGRAMRWVRREPAKAALIIAGLALIAITGYAAAKWPEMRRDREEVARSDRARAVEEAFLDLGDGGHEQASQTFRDVLDVEPDNVDAFAGLVFLLITRDRSEEALELLRQRADLTTRVPDLGRLEVEALRRLGRNVESARREDTLSPPSTAIGHFVAGLLALERGRLGERRAQQEALDHFMRARLMSDRAVYLYKLAEAAGHVGDETIARHAAAALTDRRPGSAVAWMWSALALRTIDPSQALADFEKATELDPENAYPWQFLAVERVKIGDDEGVETARQRALAAGAIPANLIFDLGLAYSQRGEAEHAERLFRETLELDAGHLLAWENLGLNLYRLERDEEAVAAFEHVIEVDPAAITTPLKLAVTLIRLGRAKDARLVLERAAEQENRHPQISYLLGRILVRERRDQEAVTHLEAAIARDPDLGVAYTELGVALGRLGREDEAIDHFETAARLRPGDAIPRYNLGRTLQRRGDMNGAVDALRAALACDPDHTDARANLALAEAARGQFREALSLMRRVVDAPDAPQSFDFDAWFDQIKPAAQAASRLDLFESGGDIPPNAKTLLAMDRVARLQNRDLTMARLWRSKLTSSSTSSSSSSSPSTSLLLTDPISGANLAAARAALRLAVAGNENSNVGDDSTAETTPVAKLSAAQRTTWRRLGVTWLAATVASWKSAYENDTLTDSDLLARLTTLEDADFLTPFDTDDFLSTVDVDEHAQWNRIRDTVDALLDEVE